MHTCLTNVLNFFVDVSAILLSDVHSTIFYEQISELKAALGTLSASGEKYCSEACLRRYLEARNWNVAKSRKMLEESLKWKAAYKPEDIRWVNLFFLFLPSMHCSSFVPLKPSQVTKHHINCLLT